MREGQKALWKKIGYFCLACKAHYDMNLKPYTKTKKSLADNDKKRILINAV